MLIVYRFVYGLSLAVFLGNLVMTIHLATTPAHDSILTIAAALSVCCLLVLLLRFVQIRPLAFWVVVLTWEALFAWFAWFSQAAPFALHEVHSLEPTIALRERMTDYGKACTLFAVLFSWFLSLPIIRQLSEKTYALQV